MGEQAESFDPQAVAVVVTNTSNKPALFIRTVVMANGNKSASIAILFRIKFINYPVISAQPGRKCIFHAL